MLEAYVTMRHKEGSNIDTLCQRAVTRFQTTVSPEYGHVVRVFVVRTTPVRQVNAHKNGERFALSEFRIIYTV